ncbi:hypothetical protein MKX67_20960 [Cytobacillus sp. FSL W7-1323]|uniref:Uncharacterized protein n=1 Tax=Cytobacillus kochii TaxID=859143 RepID=A0A248TIW4_9BACI|nr:MULTISPECIES: hypothetical protein [Cytobacillus]ASV68146.1 hypothetical protein CKF48_12940 [Cytobacillus kochii]MEA1853550.1 hypothetical protein [Cytobacillus sp. OWB-43]MED1604981.1 hypothetical protein [Cytobacillus kochii]
MGFGDMFSLVNGIIILTFVLIIPTLLIIVFVAASKVIKRYLKNGELMEEKLRMELDERQKLEHRVTELENQLKMKQK